MPPPSNPPPPPMVVVVVASQSTPTCKIIPHPKSHLPNRQEKKITNSNNPLRKSICVEFSILAIMLYSQGQKQLFFVTNEAKPIIETSSGFSQKNLTPCYIFGIKYNEGSSYKHLLFLLSLLQLFVLPLLLVAHF